MKILRSSFFAPEAKKNAAENKKIAAENNNLLKTVARQTGARPK